MNPKILDTLSELKTRRAGDRVTFRARALRFWEVGGLRMCLVGDESALTRVELGAHSVEAGASYEFINTLVQDYPGGWHSASFVEGSELVRLSEDVPVSRDEAYIERTYKILAGVQRKKGRKQGRVEPWRHPLESEK